MRGKPKRTLNKTKSLILSLLSEGRWVSSAELLSKTGQKYFDRRIRELKDESGFDIETGHVNGAHSYRLKSNKINPPKTRTYLSKSEKSKILESWDQTCSLCRKKIEEKQRSFDHKVPLLRGGSGDSSNFQIVCFDCNNRKRSSCRGCIQNCDECYLAFPELADEKKVIVLKDSTLINSIQSLSDSMGLQTEDVLREAIDQLKTKSQG